MAVSTKHAEGLVASEDVYFGAEVLTFRKKLLPRPTLQTEVSDPSCKLILSLSVVSVSTTAFSQLSPSSNRTSSDKYGDGGRHKRDTVRTHDMTCHTAVLLRNENLASSLCLVSEEVAVPRITHVSSSIFIISSYLKRFIKVYRKYVTFECLSVVTIHAVSCATKISPPPPPVAVSACQTVPQNEHINYN
jgi:hypothetical protein